MNNQNTSIGETIDVKDLMYKCCITPTLTLTAFEEYTDPEFKLLALDEIPSELEGMKPFTVGMPSFSKKTKMFAVKNIGRIFKEFTETEYGIDIDEIGNNRLMITAVADIDADTVGEFTMTSGIDAGDTVRVIKTKAGNTIPATVKVASVDHDTKEITFDTNVTIDEGDMIQFISAAQADCAVVDKKITQHYGTGQKVTFYYKIFTRAFDVRDEDYNKCFQKNSKAADNFLWSVMGRADQEIWEEASRLFRYGKNVPGPEPEPMGYDTVCQIRESAGLETIIDFSSFTLAKDLNEKLVEIWRRAWNNPMKAKPVMIMNEEFIKSYKAMHRELKDTQDCVTLKNCDTIYYGLMKYETDDFSLPEMYKSQSLTEENPYEPLAYILPQSLIALFIPPVLTTEDANGSFKKIPNDFGKMITKKSNTDKIGCRSYYKYMKLGYIFGGMTIRDMYFKLENFNYTY